MILEVKYPASEHGDGARIGFPCRRSRCSKYTRALERVVLVGQ